MEIIFESTKINPSIYNSVLDNFQYPDYTSIPEDILYHNTHLENVKGILDNGIKIGNSKQLEYSGNMTWATSTPNQKGYGGVTIAFKTNNITNFEPINNDEYCIYEDIPVSDILFIDLPVCGQPSGSVYRLSDIPKLINKFGEEKVIDVTSKMGDQYIPIETVLEYVH